MQPTFNTDQPKRPKQAPLDGVVRRQRPSPITQQPVVNSKNTHATPAVASAPSRPAPSNEPIYKKRSAWRERLELPLLITSGIIGGFLVQTAWFGVPVVLAYGLYALIFRVPSRTTFTLAALSLVAVSMLLLFKPDMQLASNFTTYTFLLLVIGVITLTIEGRPIRRKRRHRNRR